MDQLNRRSLITGLISLVAAPAIVRVSSIMPVKSVFDPQAVLDAVVAGFDLGSDDMTAAYIVECYDEKIIRTAIPLEKWYRMFNANS